MNPPKIFISATSGDLSSARQIAKEALLTINCHPVEQTNFEPDWRSVTDMLRGKISDCQALIHLVGFRYGAEPDPASLPPGTPRRSYTQMEYHLARELGLRVYTFLLPETYPFDSSDSADMPEQTQLQAAHRAFINRGPHLYEMPPSDLDLRARIIALQEKVAVLEQEQMNIAHEVRASRNWGMWAAAAVVLILSGAMFAFHRLTQHGIAEVKSGLAIDTTRIKTHLLESSEHRLGEELRAAELEKRSDDRQRRREGAQAAHQSRLVRIDELATSFASLEGKGDSSAELKEMTRILTDEGVEAALSYVERQRDVLLAADTAYEATHREQRRIRLQPLFQAAGLLATKGLTAAASAGYEDLLKRDPQWTEAQLALARTYGDQRLDFWNWGPRKDLKTTLAEAEKAVTFADSLAVQGDGHTTGSNLVLANALIWCSDLLLQRGQPGDLKLALAHIARSLPLAEAYLQANPTSAQASRDVLICQQKIGDFLAKRSQPGDEASALRLYKSSLELAEKLQAVSPDSGEATRDVSVGLVRLGNLLTQRSQPGDAEAALKYFTRSLELAEKLLAATPASVQAARDVSISLEKLGDILVKRGQSGDMDAAIKNYSASLKQREKLLAENPESAQASHNVSVSLNRLGILLVKRGHPGDVETALRYNMRSLDLSQELLSTAPDSTQAARDLSISLYSLGDFLIQRGQSGDADTALTHLTRSLELAEKLLAVAQDSAQAQRDVSASLNKLADLLAQRSQPGDLDSAIRYNSRSLELCEKLLAANPDSAQAARDASWAWQRVGDFLVRRGQPGDAENALKHYTRCLQQREKLVAANPSSAEAVRDMSWVWQRIAELLARRGQPGDAEAALQYYSRCLKQRETLLAANPRSAQTAREVLVVSRRLAEHVEKSGKGDAQEWWRRAYDVLNKMAQTGVILSEQDKKDLEMLRTKSIPKS